MRLSVALALCVLAISAAPASAAMTWELAAAVAVDHWQQRGVDVPCDPTRRVLTDAEDAQWQARYMTQQGIEFDMFADVPACQVVMSPAADWYRTEPLSAWLYCEDVVHEIGHLAGLGHERGGVMSGERGWTPFGCAHPRQWMVKQGWRKPPRWVRRSPARVGRLWLAGRVQRAQTARAHWLAHG